MLDFTQLKPKLRAVPPRNVLSKVLQKHHVGYWGRRIRLGVINGATLGRMELDIRHHFYMDWSEFERTSYLWW